MNYNKLRRIFSFCFLILIVLIIATSCDYSELIKGEENTNLPNTNVESVHTFEKFDYNNLTSTQKEYIRNMYSNNVRFTENGVEVYYEDIASGRISKIITNKWPEIQIGNLIPNPEYGELDRIEYSDNFINIYINNAKKSDAKDYLKKLKKYNFDKDERKNDGKVMLEYTVYDELENYVRIRFFKESNMLEISAKKMK